MKKLPYVLVACSLFLCNCKKETPAIAQQKNIAATQSTDFVKYIIYKGHQYCDKSSYVQVKYSELKFIVKFDSSAIYNCTNPANQLDINKLFGFSDNNADHHQFSARFGWRWSDKALYLFAYTYNDGKLSFKKLGAVKIGTENYCSIKVKPTSYIFMLNDVVDSMERKSITPEAIGYKLFPYFGGDELAPHDINIWIRELP